ncbi:MULTISPECIES: hypothetical protein [unclassified Bradyrhizobium]|uniref:hypothetical protein n=1 Tax=unclassified Bradyrhizobium TaxID=2631580 RepID=UPI0028E53D3B|nr:MULTISPECIES: hypothetical protein [unclassified Bradyrhizobium]
MRFVTFVMGLLPLMSMPANAQVSSWQGVGPVELGMTVAEAERALSAKLGPAELPFSKECYVTSRADGKDEALSYVIENDRIVVMTIFLPDYRKPNPNIVDANGVGVGSTEADITRAYGQAKKELAPDFRASEADLAEAAKERARHGITEPEPPPHYWITAESPDHKRAIIFETQDEKVLYFRVGLKPQVLSNEDCI